MALAQRLARRPQQNNAESASDAKSPREIGHRWPCWGVITIEVSEPYDGPQMRRGRYSRLLVAHLADGDRTPMRARLVQCGMSLLALR